MVNENGEYLLCVATDDCVPCTDSDIKQCSECGRDVWCSKSSPQEIAILCNHCVNKIPAEKCQHAMPTESQLIDMAQKVGQPIEVVRSKVAKIIENLNRASKFTSN